jgi:hypothetical protein
MRGLPFHYSLSRLLKSATVRATIKIIVQLIRVTIPSLRVNRFLEPRAWAGCPFLIAMQSRAQPSPRC